ncbi:MAG: Lrp/AsnC family transcriptional regulator [Candidatus Coproplasma sp.]
MEQIEKDLIAILNADSRTPIDRISAMLGVSEERVKAEVRSLEERGVIVKYTAIINEDAVGDEDGVEALIEVKVTPQRGAGFDAIAREIAEHEEVKNLYLMSGAYDLAVIVEGKSLKSISRFVSERISTYDTVLSTATHFILKKYKVEGALMKRREESDRLSVQP